MLSDQNVHFPGPGPGQHGRKEMGVGGWGGGWFEEDDGGWLGG